jgi:hypothetical protein
MEKSVSLVQSPNSPSHGVHSFVHFGSRTKQTTKKCCAQSAFFSLEKPLLNTWEAREMQQQQQYRKTNKTRLLLLLSVPSS